MTEATGGIEMEEDAGGKVKKFLYINRKAPYGTIYALESLEVVLIAAAFDQDVSLAFLDDGVYQVVKGQDTKPIDVKNFSPTYRALVGYDIEQLYVEKGCAVLLIEAGIYGALKGTVSTKMVEQALKNHPIYALYPDIEARGMQDRVIAGIKLVDYSGVVDLGG